MTATDPLADPVNLRLLGMLAEFGRVAVPELAARMRIDPREVAARLLVLATRGAPLTVGVDCDPLALRAMLSGLAAGFAAPPPATTAPASKPANHIRVGEIGRQLHTTGIEGEAIAITVLEVVDPADALFQAAGFTLRAGERAVVVHTELRNDSPRPYPMLADLYLMLVTDAEEKIGKAPLALSSRPPHRIGIEPGATAGGHAVYVIGEDVTITSVRWYASPDSEQNTLTWSIPR
ncbi:MAG: AsnC family protein [Sciscionella sp.]